MHGHGGAFARFTDGAAVEGVAAANAVGARTAGLAGAGIAGGDAAAETGWDGLRRGGCIPGDLPVLPGGVAALSIGENPADREIFACRLSVGGAEPVLYQRGVRGGATNGQPIFLTASSPRPSPR